MTRLQVLYVFILTLLVLISCVPEDEPYGGYLCEGYSFSIIDKDEWQQNENLVNLLGKDGHPFNPDNVVIINEDGNTMFSVSGRGGLVDSTEPWWLIGGFSYYDDLGCVTIRERIELRYFVHLNEDDVDTMDIILTPGRSYPNLKIFYNGCREVSPTLTGTSSSYWFLKNH